MQLSTTARGHKGLGMNGFIATWYAKNVRKNLAQYQEDARRLAGHLGEGSDVLEVATGPGWLAIELARLGRHRVVGLDISESFVRIAKANAREAGVAVEFRQGDASAMPFGPDSFDLVACRAAFKNFRAPAVALDEMHRVLRPGGEAVIIDLRPDLSWQAIDDTVRALHLGGVDALLTKLIFRFMLTRRAYRKEQLESLVAQSHFGGAEILELPISYEVWLRK